MATITRQVRDIHQAFRYRQMDVIKDMLTETPTLVDAVDAGGRTLLHRAAWWGEADLVALLLEHGARADIANANGSTAINIATDRRGENTHGRQIMRLLAAHGSNAFLPARNRLLLVTIAMQHEDAELVRAIFIGNPNQVNCASCNGKYPLHLAVACGYTEIVRLLCSECGADPNIRDEYAQTALHCIKRNTPLDVVRVLLAAGADVNAIQSGGETPLHTLVREKGSLEAARLLVEAGAEVNTYSSDYLTPMHHATLAEDSEGFIDLLLNAGADVDAKGTPCDTPLMVASGFRQHASVRLLLARGANVHAIDENGNTALQRAVSSGQCEGVAILLAAGADPDAPNHVGITPIEVAVRYKRESSHLLAAKSSRPELRQAAQRGGDHLYDYMRHESQTTWHELRTKVKETKDQTSPLRLMLAEWQANKASTSATN